MGCAVLFDAELDRRAFDKRGQNLAGDVRVNSVAVCLFFSLDPGGEILGSQVRIVSRIPNLQQATRYAMMDLEAAGSQVRPCVWYGVKALGKGVVCGGGVVWKT